MEAEHIQSISRSEEMSKIPGPLFKSFHRVGRHWLKRSRPVFIERRKEKNFEFTIASYNVLADTLLHDHPHLYQGNHGNEPWVYDWNYRKRNLIEEIKYSNADVSSYFLIYIFLLLTVYIYNCFFPKKSINCNNLCDSRVKIHSSS